MRSSDQLILLGGSHGFDVSALFSPLCPSSRAAFLDLIRMSTEEEKKALAAQLEEEDDDMPGGLKQQAVHHRLGHHRLLNTTHAFNAQQMLDLDKRLASQLLPFP